MNTHEVGITAMKIERMSIHFFRLILFLGLGTLGILGWGCAAGTLEPLGYTTASVAEFCYPILD